MLVGNVPFAAAALVALALAVAVIAVGRSPGNTWESFQIGSAAVLLILTALALTVDDAFNQRWILPLGNAGVFAVALLGALLGKPFARASAAAEQPDDVVKTALFARMAWVLTWAWIATFAGMTVSSAVPPIVDPKAGLQDTAPVSYVCYWIIPFSLLGVAALASRILPDRMLAGIDDVARETSFVAYDEATIDELYYLAQEHANREVGPGKEAYNVKVGGMGTPLTGDESRKSWPSTYKVRVKRR